MADTKVFLSGGRIQGASTDATGAVDTLGTAVNGSNSGCVTSSDTPFYGDTSVTFDNHDAAHDFGTTSSFAGLVKEDFTVTFWAKCSGKGNMGWGQGSNPTSSPYAGNQGCVLCLGQISGGGNGVVISFDDNNTNQFFVCGGDGSNVFLNDTQNDGADHDNNYHLYMLHFDNTNEELRVYRDGSATPRDTTPYGQQVTSTAATTYDKMYMGRQNQDDIRYYIGQLADVSIWKRLLTTAEFTQLWGTFEDNTSTATNSVKGVRVDALTNQAGLLAHWKLDDLNFTNSAVATDKSKTSITNVPAGTRYEETDTRKIFRYKPASSSVTGVATPSGLGDYCMDMTTNGTVYRTTGQLINDGDSSVSLWYYPTVNGEEMSFFKHWSAGGASTYAQILLIGGSGQDEVVLFTRGPGTSGQHYAKTVGNVLTLNKWNLITATWDASLSTANQGRIYINGDEPDQASGYPLDTGSTSTIRAVSDWAFGASGQAGSPTGTVEDLRGYVCDVAFWNVPLTEANHVSMWNSYNQATNVG